MRLIVTRPEPDCTLTVQRLADMGHVAIAAPLLTVTLMPSPALPEPPKAILVTSQNGVRALAAWPEHKQWLDLPAFAVGAATARALTAAGFSNVLAGDGDGAALADLVARALAPDGGPILYPAARDRAADIPGMLEQRGHDMRLVEAYAAEPVAMFPPDAEAAIRAGVDGVLLYSRRTAATLATLLSGAGLTEAAARATFYVLSEQVADGVRFIGAPIKVAERPDEDSLFALIKRG